MPVRADLNGFYTVDFTLFYKSSREGEMMTGPVLALVLRERGCVDADDFVVGAERAHARKCSVWGRTKYGGGGELRIEN